MKLDLTSLIAGLTLLSMIGGGYYGLDATYAREEKVAAIDQRLQQKITNDARRDLQGELWRLQDRYGRQCERGDQAIRDRCRAIIEELKELEKK